MVLIDSSLLLSGRKRQNPNRACSAHAMKSEWLWYGFGMTLEKDSYKEKERMCKGIECLKAHLKSNMLTSELLPSFANYGQKIILISRHLLLMEYVGYNWLLRTIVRRHTARNLCME
jgi:hypothetical protein